MKLVNYGIGAKKDAPENHEDFAGFVINDRGTGQEVHRECVPTGRLSDNKVADLLVRRRERLEKKYAPSHYDVDAGLFNSKASFEHFFPTRSKTQKS
jgi:hypothetical protein